MAHLAADLRYAVRSLRKVPLFTSIAVLSMAFGTVYTVPPVKY